MVRRKVAKVVTDQGQGHVIEREEVGQGQEIGGVMTEIVIETENIVEDQDQDHQDEDLLEGHHHVGGQGHEIGIEEGHHLGHVHVEVLVQQGVDTLLPVDRDLLHLEDVEIPAGKEIGTEKEHLHLLQKERKGVQVVLTVIRTVLIRMHLQGKDLQILESQ